MLNQNKLSLLLKCMAILGSYKLRMVADTAKSLEEFTSTEHFFQIVNVWGLTINHAKSKNKSLSIKVDNKNSYVYLDNLVSNDGSAHKISWLVRALIIQNFEYPVVFIRVINI